MQYTHLRGWGDVPVSPQMEAESHSAMNPEVYSCLPLVSDNIFCIGFAEKAFQDRLNFDQLDIMFTVLFSPALSSYLQIDITV